jgi:hypothetical protein
MDLQWLETNVAPWVLLVGIVVVLIASVWLLIAAFRTRVWWGLLCLIPPLFLLFVIFRWRRARWPFGALLLGLLLLGAAGGIVWFSASQLVEHDQIVKEEVDGKEVVGRHLTLNGWGKKTYAGLLAKPDTVVLQMANPDVTDDTLVYVLPMQGLYELDLDDTQITDRGLALLKNLPHLERLHLKGTHITDAGFRENLLPIGSLMELDLRETAVEKDTVKEWRQAKEGRRARR